jgi:hypothetical protein
MNVPDRSGSMPAPGPLHISPLQKPIHAWLRHRINTTGRVRGRRQTIEKWAIGSTRAERLRAISSSARRISPRYPRWIGHYRLPLLAVGLALRNPAPEDVLAGGRDQSEVAAAQGRRAPRVQEDHVRAPGARPRPSSRTALCQAPRATSKLCCASTSRNTTPTAPPIAPPAAARRAHSPALRGDRSATATRSARWLLHEYVQVA